MYIFLDFVNGSQHKPSNDLNNDLVYCFDIINLISIITPEVVIHLYRFYVCTLEVVHVLIIHVLDLKIQYNIMDMKFSN